MRKEIEVENTKKYNMDVKCQIVNFDVLNFYYFLDTIIETGLHVEVS